jgi:hypothetical protein
MRGTRPHFINLQTQVAAAVFFQQHDSVSGVIGSVISLFITTMTYVILDIQLLKSGKSIAIDEPVITVIADCE